MRKVFFTIFLVFPFLIVCAQGEGDSRGGTQEGLFSAGESSVCLRHGLTRLEKIYDAYSKAVHAGDWNAMQRYLSTENRAQLLQRGPPQQTVNIQMLFTPRDFEVLQCAGDDTQKVLFIRGAAAFGEVTGLIYFIKEEGEWKLYNEQWGLLEDSAGSPEQESLAFPGTISGTIILPEVPLKGDLFISISDPEEGTSYRMVVAKEAAASGVVSFTKDGILPGTYIIKAVWDTASPFCKKDSQQACISSGGDYSGTSEVPLQIREGSTIAGVTVQCNSLVYPASAETGS